MSVPDRILAHLHASSCGFDPSISLGTDAMTDLTGAPGRRPPALPACLLPQSYNEVSLFLVLYIPGVKRVCKLSWLNCSSIRNEGY